MLLTVLPMSLTSPSRTNTTRRQLANPTASRVRNLKYQGKEIDPNQDLSL